MLPLALLLILLTNLLPLSSLAAISDSSSSYHSFLKCMQKHSPKNVSNEIYSQSNTSYTSVLRAYIRNARFNTSSTKKPLLIVTATSDSHVSATVICTKTLGLRLKTRSGGHDYAGLSYVCDVPFVILDMFRQRSIEVDAADRSAWVQAGATLGELYYSIWKSSNLLGFPAGICPTVGAGGHISGGGYGNMLRKHGLASDHVVDAKIVDAKGNILDRKSMGEDTFWAIRGGGGASFGVVLSYKWQNAAPTTDDGLFMRMLLQPSSSTVKESSITVKSTIVALYLGNAEELVSILEKDFPLLGLKKENCTELSWMGSVLWWNNVQNGTSPDVLLNRKPNSAVSGVRKSDYVQKPISKSGLESLWMKMIELGKIGLVFNPYGGRMSEIPASETPFPHRAGNLFKIQYSVSWSDSGAEAERDCVTKIRSLFSFMTPYVSENPRSAYLNYRDLDIGINHFGKNSYEEGKVYGVKYFNDNFDRLVKVKTAVDPENFFKNEQSIPILPSKVFRKILA
ncbi:Xanthine dehydrogenase C subunit [Trema orientale]|uniref:Xanthine dehydrogenase C subunit n=1 Tax=Trema orientale TaxID=63057 RepID=A0A2P5FTG4_TREOI|nr:Xanthine dehydrogenase C subunit [Trema orientale]